MTPALEGDGDPEALRIRLRIGFRVRLALLTRHGFRATCLFDREATHGDTHLTVLALTQPP